MKKKKFYKKKKKTIVDKILSKKYPVMSLSYQMLHACQILSYTFYHNYFYSKIYFVFVFFMPPLKNSMDYNTSIKYKSKLMNNNQNNLKVLKY